MAQILATEPSSLSGIDEQVQVPAQETLLDAPVLLNGDFSDGLRGWQVLGMVAVEPTSSPDGELVLCLGPGVSAVSQRLPMAGLRIIGVGATLHGSLPDRPLLLVRCRDVHGRLLMEVEGIADPKRIDLRHGVDQTYAYLKTQADTASIEIIIAQPAGDPLIGGPMQASGVWLDATDTSHLHRQPVCDLVALMQPLWSAPVVIDEPVLLWREGADPAQGNLLLPPAQVLTVRSADLRTTYRLDLDYRFIGRSLVRLPGSSMPELSAGELLPDECAWNCQLERWQVVVTYRPAQAWRGMVPTDQRDRLLRTTARLRHGLPLRIVAIGDSITNGSQSSGHRGVEPFMPGWPELFAGELRRRFRHDQVVLTNAALGGATSAWGAAQAACTVAPLQPDLVIIAFGMNDFWTIDAPVYQRHLESLMETVRATSPLAEFVLVASMAFDPAYTGNRRYHQRLRNYAGAVRDLGGPGVAALDLHTLSMAIYAGKKPKDCLADPLHPNDYLTRWYAQGLVQVVAGTDPDLSAQAPRP